MEHEDQLYRNTEIQIEVDAGTFPFKAMPLMMTVTNGSTTIESFWVDMTGNQRGIIGFFTEDAFDSFTGLSEISFGYAGDVPEVIPNVDIAGEAMPRTPQEDAMTTLEADNAWLASL